MSHITYNQQWHESHIKIAQLIKSELPSPPDKPEKDRTTVFQKLATLFIKYVQLFRKLETCYDQIVHPQKRLVLKQVLEGTMGRLLEVKAEMVKLELSEYHYLDDVLADMKLTPNDLEIPIPRYYVNNYRAQLKERERLLGSILKRVQPHGGAPGRPKKMPMEDAVRMIQINERARQGRLRAKFMREIRIEEEREKKALQRGPPTINASQAAVRIQRTWKGYLQRKITNRERQEEMLFLGMGETTFNEKRTKAIAATLKTEENRRVIQIENETDYQQALITTRQQMLEVEGPDMKEAMMDQIRQWFIECKDLTGKLPDYPSVDEGGMGWLFSHKTPDQIDEELRLKNVAAPAAAVPVVEQEGWKMGPSKFLGSLATGHNEYLKKWKNRDERDNFPQKHENQLIKELKHAEVEAEVRVHVDVLMREELANLKLAIDKEMAKVPKKSKPPKKGKGKGKKEKDLTVDRTTESLFEELIQQGVLRPCPQVKLKDYIGDYNYLATSLRLAGIEPQPSAHDVRQLVSLYGIIPLGSEIVHSNMPQIKSILLAGPRGVGKKLLLHAICTETGANFFDLSANNIVGRYPGKVGLELLIHSVWRVASELKPSVIYIGECDLIFAKKVPPGDTTEPNRLKKDLPALLKRFKPGNRILVVGISREPFNAAPGPFCKAFQRIIMIPRPDYSSRLCLWPELIRKYGGVITPKLDMSSLAKVSDGYTAGDMVTAITAVLTPRRKAQLAKNPLTAMEFVIHISRTDPIYKEDEEVYQKWYKKTPLGKAREKFIKAALEAANPGAADKDKKGKKGKGKKGKK